MGQETVCNMKGVAPSAGPTENSAEKPATVLFWFTLTTLSYFQSQRSDKPIELQGQLSYHYQTA